MKYKNIKFLNSLLPIAFANFVMGYVIVKAIAVSPDIEFYYMMGFAALLLFLYILALVLDIT